MSRSKTLQQQLGDYPLAAYVEYHRLNNQLGQVSPAQIDDFRERNAQLPATALLYQRWLKLQGQRRQWRQLHQRRYDTSNAELKCYFVRAQYGVGEKTAALDATTALWVQPKSQPKACDPIFAVWRGTDRLTQDLVWQRLDGAMAASQWVLARYLQRYLSGAKRTAAKAYYELRREPQRVAWRGAFAANSAENRAAIGYGIRRLAGRDAEKAAKAWAIFRDSHSFGGAERQMLDDHVAVGLAKIGQFPSTEQRPAHGSDFATQGLMNAAIAGEHWDELVYWISRLDASQKNKARSRYWLARAQRQSGQPAAFTELAKQRSYYGFLAASQLQTEAALQALPNRTLTMDEETALLQIPGVARAVELFAMGEDLNGRREWYQLQQQQDGQTLHAMAHLAQRMGKLFLAIQTANGAAIRDDLKVRFPLAYATAFHNVALRHDVDANLLRAIARQESAFQVRAKSSAGALGLMQVMPATAKLAMRRGNLAANLGKGSGQAIEQDLLIPERNIEIGSYHLAWLLERYDNQRPLAIAAYNAGERRVDRWIKSAANTPMDVWIETIPFKETRNYVQNVLAFEVVYRGLDQRPLPILRNHEWVTPGG